MSKTSTPIAFSTLATAALTALPTVLSALMELGAKSRSPMDNIDQLNDIIDLYNNLPAPVRALLWGLVRRGVAAAWRRLEPVLRCWGARLRERLRRPELPPTERPALLGGRRRKEVTTAEP